MTKQAEIMTVKQISDLCGVSTETIRRWIRQGHLQGYNTIGGRTIRVLRQDFEAFVARNNILTEGVLKARLEAPMIEQQQAM